MHQQVQHDITPSGQENGSPSSSPLRKKTFVEDINDVEIKDSENSSDKIKPDDVVKRETEQTCGFLSFSNYLRRFSNINNS